MTDNPNSQKRERRALDLAAVWSRGIALLRDNFQLIAILAGVFVLLPNAALQFALPSSEDIQGPFEALMDPNASQAMQEKATLALGEMFLPIMGYAAPTVVIAHIGYAGIVALIGRARPTVGEALAQSLRVILPLIIAIIIAVLAIYAVLFVVQLVLTPLGPNVAAFLGAVLGFLAWFYLTARLYLTLPVMVIEWELNPVKALLRSWRLTSAARSNVFGFWMMLAVAWFVTLMIQSAVSALLSSIPGPGPTADLIQGLFGGLFSMVWGSIYCAMGVSLHATLKGPDAEEIAADFE